MADAQPQVVPRENGVGPRTVGVVMVVGAGQMGGGIAQVAAQAGYTVLLHDVEEAILRRARAAMEKSLGRLVKRGALSDEDAAATLARITDTTELVRCREAGLVVEAAVERLDVKKDLFSRLDRDAPDSAILATNTSSLSITEIGGATGRPERTIGMHFMNPVPVMPLVEMIRGLQTSDETFSVADGFVRSLGKTPVDVKDFPGFVSNRVLMPMINEAVFAVYEGVATPEAVDAVMKLGMNHPMGPLELADFIGLDTCLYIMEVLHAGFSDSKYRPCPLLRQYVAAGRLGRKSGAGFYRYN